MGRILFFIVLAFCAFLAVRIVVKARRGNPASTPLDTRPEPATPTAEASQSLTACPLCTVHIPTTELSAHLKQSHGAT